MSDASLAASFSSLITFRRVAIDSYSSAKSFSMSTPSLLFGRSRMWPIDATTLKSRPRYLLIVFAFAGDSTTTSAFAIATFLFTLARTVNPDESRAADARYCTLQLELEQPRQQARRCEPAARGDVVQIARLPRRQALQDRVMRGAIRPRPDAGSRAPHPELFEDVVHRFDNRS